MWIKTNSKEPIPGDQLWQYQTQTWDTKYEPSLGNGQLLCCWQVRITSINNNNNKYQMYLIFLLFIADAITIDMYKFEYQQHIPDQFKPIEIWNLEDMKNENNHEQKQIVDLLSTDNRLVISWYHS